MFKIDNLEIFDDNNELNHMDVVKCIKVTNFIFTLDKLKCAITYDFIKKIDDIVHEQIGDLDTSNERYVLSLTSL